MNEMWRKPTSAREVLAKLISAPYVLAGRDLLTGERFTRLHAEDLDDFVDAHLLGPGRRDRPARITVDDEAGERCVESFLRPELLPVAGDETCTHIVVTVRTSNAVEPEEGLLATAIALREQPAQLLLERSVLTGVWCLWFVFPSPIKKQEATAIAHGIRRMLETYGTSSLKYEIPLLDEGGSARTLLPCPFYHGDFLGVLFSISHDAYLTALSIEPHSDGGIRGGTEAARCSGGSDVQDALEGMLASWCATCPSRSARAGEIISTLSERGMLQGTFAMVAPDSAAILLGRHLLAYAKRGDGRFAVTATQSGHSKRFLIQPRERSIG